MPPPPGPPSTAHAPEVRRTSAAKSGKILAKTLYRFMLDHSFLAFPEKSSMRHKLAFVKAVCHHYHFAKCIAHGPRLGFDALRQTSHREPLLHASAANGSHSTRMRLRLPADPACV